MFFSGNKSFDYLLADVYKRVSKIIYQIENKTYFQILQQSQF